MGRVSLKTHRQNHNACYLCAKKRFQTLYSFDDFDIVRCKQCGLVSTTFSVDRAVLEEMYSASYYHQRRDYYFQNIVTNNKAIKENANIKEFKRGLSLIERYKDGGKLLDIGCAIGVFLSLARKRGWKTYGVDISQYAASFAREVLGLKVFAGELGEVKFPGKCFDVITLWDVLEHLPDSSIQLQEIRRVLKDDGILLMNTPNESALLRLLAWRIFRLSGRKISYPIRKLYHQFHLSYFTPQTLQYLLEKNGFELILLEQRCIPVIKARGRPLERLIVKVISWAEQLCHKEYELLVIAKKQG